MSCPSVDTLSNTTFADTCLIGNVQNNQKLQDAMKTCCGSSKITTLDNGCTNYCNITTLQDSIYWSYCLEDTLDTATYLAADDTCFVSPEKVDIASYNPTATGAIATTWTAQDKNFTETVTADGMTQTMVDNPAEDNFFWVAESVLPSKAATSAGASTTTGAAPKSTGTSSAPSATKSMSAAEHVSPISRFTVAALGGLLLFGLVS